MGASDEGGSVRHTRQVGDISTIGAPMDNYSSIPAFNCCPVFRSPASHMAQDKKSFFHMARLTTSKSLVSLCSSSGLKVFGLLGICK